MFHPPVSRPDATVSRNVVEAVLDAALAARLPEQPAATALRAQLGLLAGGAAGRASRLPERTLIGLWKALLAAAGGDHGIGAALALHADARSFGVVGEALRLSSTPIEAYAHLARYARLIHQGVTITSELHSDELVVGYELAGAGDAPAALTAGMLWAMANLALLPRRAFGASLAPVAAELACPPPANAPVMREVFGPNLSFASERWRLVFARSEVEKVRRAADARLFAYLGELAERDLQSLPPATDITALVSIELRRGLAGRAPDLDDVARALGLSPRTLQRRIAASGSSFSTILDELRKARARELIAENARPLGEIAYLLGYSEPAAFSRAARRWFGVAPRRMWPD